MLGNNHKLDKSITLINQANYSALCVLEQMGLDAPSQKQIDIIETLLLIAIKPKLIPFKLIKNCITNDSIARRIFFRHLSSKLKSGSECKRNLSK